MNKKIFNYFEILLLIIVSFSPILDTSIKALIVFMIFLINIKILRRINRQRAYILGAFLIIFVISFAFDLRNVESLTQINILNLYFPLCFIVGLQIIEKYNIKQYLHFIEKIVYVSAIFSLIGVFIYTSLPNLIVYFPTYTNDNITRHTAYVFNFMTDSDGHLLERNAGIAWEPGAYQFLLNLALYVHIKYNKKISFFKILIYFAAIFFTKSTGGLIIFIVITFKFFMSSRMGRILIFASLLLFGSRIFEELNYHLTYKLFGSGSFEVRLEPLMKAFAAGKSYLFGIGNSGFDLFYRTITTPPYDSYGQLFIRYGYVLTIFILFRLLALLKNHTIILIIIIITFSSENIWYFPIVTPFYFLIKNSRDVKIKELKFDESSVVDKYSITRSE